MFVLHALWRADRTLAVWGEDARPMDEPDTVLPSRSVPPFDPAASAAPRAADAPVANPAGAFGMPGAAPLHPYVCGVPVLTELLAGVGSGLAWLVAQADTGAAVLRLPTFGGTLPQPSPELPGPPVRGPRPDLAFASWTVPALVFDADQAAQLLGALFEPRHAALRTELEGVGAVDVPYGASLRWLTAVHDLAWRMVGRGHVLPGVLVDRAVSVSGAAGEAAADHRSEAAAYARWSPAPNEDEHELMRDLAAACPPVCRAEDLGRPPTPTALLADLLDALVDREVRAVLEGGGTIHRSGSPDSRRIVPRAAVPGEQWLAALAAPSGRFTLAPDAAASLADAVAAWHATEIGTVRPLRTCFRLVEPLGPDPADLLGRPTDDNWRLDILVQAPDEPSLIVDARTVWTAGPVLDAFERKQHRPQEALRADLERAARIWPALAETRTHARPASVPLDRAGALDFLREAAPALADAGFGVLLPAWWRRPPRLGLLLSARTTTPGVVTGGSVLDRDAVVDFGWRAALGDQPLTDEELRDLAAAKQPLVRFRGQWIEADREAITAALKFLDRERTGTMGVGEVVRMAVDPGASVAGLPVFGIDADAWLGELLAGAEAFCGQSGEPGTERGGTPAGFASGPPGFAAEPPGFAAELRSYQRDGVAWLAFLSRLGLGAVLADDMGLGKTVQTLALVASEAADAGDAVSSDGGRRTLVVCPMSLVGNWLRETRRFTPGLRVHVHHGATRTDDTHALRAADIVITTYETAHRDIDALRTVAWDRIVADEAQHIKNIATRQSQAVRSLRARHRIALTGTPMENRLAELHSVLDFANPGLFGSAEDFKARYAIAIERNGSERALAALRRVTAPFLLRRRKTDPAIARDLPDKQEITVRCMLTPEQAGLYQAVVGDMLHRMANTPAIERQGLMLATLGKLKQICNHPAQFLKEPEGLTRIAGRSGKVERLVDTLEEASAEGDKTLVFTQYAAFGRLIAAHVAERLDTEVLFLHGGVSGRQRAQLVDRFQDPHGPKVFVLSLKAGGTGLNLTAATQVIHIDRWWNPAVEDQATDRAHRIGQQQAVQVRKFVCAGTVEEHVDTLIAGKRVLADAVIGGDGGLDGSGSGWLTGLSADALRELVALRDEEAT